MFQDELGLYAEKHLDEFESTFQLQFKDKSLLITALSHRSSLGPTLTSRAEMKRLALMGDKLIDLFLYRVLYRKGIQLKDMNKARRLTKNIELNKVADELGFTKYLILENSADEKIQRESVSFGSDSLEALVGAIFIDAGFDESERYVENSILPSLLKFSFD